MGTARSVGIALIGAGCTLLAASGCGPKAQSDDSSAASSQTPSTNVGAAELGSKTASSMAGAGHEALRKAAAEGKYLFAFFWKSEDGQTKAMRQVFDATMAKLTDRAHSVAVNVTDPAEKGLVSKFGLNRAPMPLVLAIAPNGAITGGFPSKFEEKDLVEAFATPCTQKCMKLLQDGRLVLLCIQNEKTGSNAAAMKGVRDFQTDPRFSQATEIVMLDPSDKVEASFLGDLQVSPETKDAVTVFLAPPGSPVGMFEGATNKDQLVDTLQKSSSVCGPGECGPGGCGPKK